MMRWQSSAIMLVWCFLLSLSPHTDSNPFPEKNWDQDNKTENFVPASPPTSLAVTVSAYNVTRKLLQLNIHWTPGNEGRRASSYNIHVRSLNDTNTLCSTDPYYAFIDDPNCTSWTISPKTVAGPYDEVNMFKVLPECAYRIRVEANPHDGKTYKEVDYTVPDCHEGICSCHHAKLLPRPALQAEHINEDTVKLTWYLSDLRNITSFYLRAGPKLLGGTHSGVYNLTWSSHIPASTDSFYHEYYTADKTGMYAASLQVVDTRECLGPEQQLVFTIENGTYTSEAVLTRVKSFWSFPLSLGLFLIVAVGLGVFLVYKYSFSFRYKTSSETFNHGALYKVIRLRSERVFRKNNPLQERNVLYVEKEIEDAKARGEADNFEISFSRLTFLKEIGSGAFGEVFLAKAEAIRGVPGSRLVAVKQLKTKVGAEGREEFLEEISMLKNVGQHPNVVALLACCTLESNLCMVMEYVPFGDLLKYLRNLRIKLDEKKSSINSASDVHSSTSTVMTSIYPQVYSVSKPEESQLVYTLDHRELHNFALQIARGMAHLEAKRITHRDLAARNILIDHNKVLKISDFGLSRRGIYVNTRMRKVPLRWLSVEAMKDCLYSSKSDVWSFAVLLWEIGTLGGFPYPTVTDYDLLNFLKQGYRLEKPELVSDKLYSVMLVCWSEKPDDRPSFAELVAYLQANTNHVYVQFSPNPQFPPTVECDSMKTP